MDIQAHETAPVAATRIPPERQEAAQLALAAKSPNTRRAYRRWLERLNGWLDGRELTDETLAAFVAALDRDGLSPASLAQAAAAAAWMARYVPDSPNPLGAMTRDRLAIARADNGDRGRGQARPITADEAAAMIAVADDPRDKAIVGLLFHGALRRSEVAALEWRDIAESTIDGALLVQVRRSKTNRHGTENDIRMVKNGAAAALREMQDAAEPAGRDAVIGLEARQINNRFQALARKAGIAGAVSAHSGRVGHASELTARGASTTEVMLSGGWKSAQMVRHYSSGATAERGAVAKYL